MLTMVDTPFTGQIDGQEVTALFILAPRPRPPIGNRRSPPRRGGWRRSPPRRFGGDRRR